MMKTDGCYCSVDEEMSKTPVDACCMESSVCILALSLTVVMSYCLIYSNPLCPQLIGSVSMVISGGPALELRCHIKTSMFNATQNRFH